MAKEKHRCGSGKLNPGDLHIINAETLYYNWGFGAKTNGDLIPQEYFKKPAKHITLQDCLYVGNKNLNFEQFYLFAYHRDANRHRENDGFHIVKFGTEYSERLKTKKCFTIPKVDVSYVLPYYKAETPLSKSLLSFLLHTKELIETGYGFNGFGGHGVNDLCRAKKKAFVCLIDSIIRERVKK